MIGGKSERPVGPEWGGEVGLPTLSMAGGEAGAGGAGAGVGGWTGASAGRGGRSGISGIETGGFCSDRGFGWFWTGSGTLVI